MERLIYSLLAMFFSISVFGQSDSIKKKDNEVTTIVEVVPEFIGGFTELQEYIETNATYTENALNKRIIGKVYVSFYVEADGSITEPTIVKSLHPDLDSISLQIIKKMPKWKPGYENGEPKRFKYNLPIEFDYNKSKKKKKRKK